MNNLKLIYKKLHIRSFVKRRRCLTIKQKQILKKLWIKIGINYKNHYINLNKFFIKTTSIILEIGFGIGKTLINTALKYPKKNFLGIETYLPGISSCLNNIYKLNIKNIRIIYYDALEVIKYMIKDNSIKLIQIFFPDPWYKKCHNKRRIIKQNFIILIKKKLIKNGILHISTDCKLYAIHILKVMSLNKNFYNISIKKKYINFIKNRPVTKFEKKGIKLKNKIIDLVFKKIF